MSISISIYIYILGNRSLNCEKEREKLLLSLMTKQAKNIILELSATFSN